MNPLVYHLVSGQSFFSGCALLLLAIWFATQRRAGLRRYRVLPFVIGVILVALSSTPLPFWMYCGIAFVMTLWFSSKWIDRLRWLSPRLLAACLFLVVIHELSFHRMRPRPAHTRKLLVVGDSVTAGLGDDADEVTWPELLRSEHQLAIQDISHFGETAASALKRAKAHAAKADTIIVEIGGNDLLGETTASQFEQDLDALIAFLHTSDTPPPRIIMFELPLPPLAHQYGYAQRTVAQRYNLRMIPKRVFLSVLAEEDSTLDTIHLSQAGHDRMARVVWSLLGGT